ncbi:hydrolase, partial [Oryctes borbonicus]
MLWMAKRRYIKRFTLTALKVLIVLFITIFVVPPFVFKYSYKLQQNVVFPAFVNIPRNPNYSNPSKFELLGSRNFYVENENNVRLGVWHILPENFSRVANVASKDDSYFDEALSSGETVVIYNHGNSANRAATYRIAMYKFLRKYFHVVAYDYRGYGDSTDVPPTETGVVSDCLIIYQWVANRTSAKIFIWGHSLGTAISTHAVSILGTQNLRPFGLILESPFTNMREEINEYPLSKLFRFLPWFHSTIVEPMQENKFIFATDRHILTVDCPILILHAEDDGIVPFHLGYKLYRETLQYRKPDQGSIAFIGFSRGKGYGHKQIFRA